MNKITKPIRRILWTVRIEKEEDWKRYRLQKWLFEGSKEGRHLSARAADKIFRNACSLRRRN